MVKFGKHWDINSDQEYTSAMQELENAEFFAWMSDDHSAYEREMDEIARQRMEVTRQAKEKGII